MLWVGRNVPQTRLEWRANELRVYIRQIDGFRGALCHSLFVAMPEMKWITYVLFIHLLRWNWWCHERSLTLPLDCLDRYADSYVFHSQRYNFAGEWMKLMVQNSNKFWRGQFHSILNHHHYTVAKIVWILNWETCVGHRLVSIVSRAALMSVFYPRSSQ